MRTAAVEDGDVERDDGVVEAVGIGGVVYRGGMVVVVLMRIEAQDALDTVVVRRARGYIVSVLWRRGE